MSRNAGQRGMAAAVAAAFALSLAACGSGTDRRAIAASLVGGSAGFYPEDITVDKEDTVLLKVGNGTDRVHGFSIEGYRVRREVQPNETLDVKLRAFRAGTFKIYCQLHPTHQPATLVVR
jgi:heme/copper-type cytochrome/quinol oxidase subunit 2